jgi:iron complex outermembrane receptor protein
VDSAQPWLGAIGGAWPVQPGWVAYAGATRGLEESGVAPANASNRNQALPAIITTQQDAGLRWQIRPQLRWVLGVFDVRKPYFNLDANGLFTQLGEVRHRGVETSLAGPVLPGLRLLVGGLWMQPRVRGDAVALGRVGARPVGQPERALKLNAVWTPEALPALSLDAGLTHTGPMPATRDNRVSLPAATRLDLGLRWSFDPRTSLRLRASNATNVHGYELRGAGLYAEAPGRLVELALSSRW